MSECKRKSKLPYARRRYLENTKNSLSRGLDPLMRIHAIAAFLDIHPDEAREMCRKGEILAFKVGDEWRARWSSVESYVRRFEKGCEK